MRRLPPGRLPTTEGLTCLRLHPHGRGEDDKRSARPQIGKETPPRAWGRRQAQRTPADWQGNTPTGVGKTSRRRTDAECGRKHPHGRGEDPLPLLSSLRVTETPPRAWGRLHIALEGGQLVGNTPTGVGKTRYARRRSRAEQKHPHGRGEDRPHVLPGVGYKGTPPRAWGRQGTADERHLWPGNTPRAWGRRKRRAALALVKGNTPTGVGKTSSGHWQRRRT